MIRRSIEVLEEQGIELRPIPGIVGYAAGSDGNIYSFRAKRSGRWRYSTGAARLSACWKCNRDKRRRVAICWRGQKTHQVSALVCAAFHGPRPEGADCSHLDGNRRNDRPANLAWETRAENEARKKEHGTVARGRRNGAAKLQDEQVREIRRLHRMGMSQSELARLFGIARSTTQSLLKGETWGHVADGKEDGDGGE